MLSHLWFHLYTLDGGDGFVYALRIERHIIIDLTYGEFADAEFGSGGRREARHDFIYNAFLIPYDFKENRNGLLPENIRSDSKERACFGYMGYASLVDGQSNLKGNKPHERVLGILVDTKWLMQNIGKISKKEMADFIKEMFKKTS